MTFLWILLGILYFIVLVTLGVSTLSKGHYLLFAVGIFLPFFWLIGALLGPTPRAASVH
jgi:ATP/ADP translocase